MNEHEMNEFRAVLDTVAEKVPNIIKNLMISYYSPENAANMGRAIGTFYKELVAAGIPEDKAIKMAQDYMISFEKLSSEFKGGKNG